MKFHDHQMHQVEQQQITSSKVFLCFPATTYPQIYQNLRQFIIH